MVKKVSDLSPKLQVEALLFSSGRTMSEEQLATLTGLAPLAVRSGLIGLQQEYLERDGAITIFNDPTGWKMMIRDKYVPVVRNIVADTELTRACMETLAVIAYKYPKVLQSEVIDIRGSGAYEHMAELERLGFIGRSPEGRSYAVKLTEKFFTYFDVAGGKDIREVFKNIKIPKRVVGEQKTLGDLEVIEAQQEVPKIIGMEVVEVPPAEEKPAEEEQPEEEETAPPAPEDHSEYLDDLDARIAKLQQRNNDLDQDELLKRKPLPGMDDAKDDSSDTDKS